MKKYGRIDANQNEIIKQLRSIPGVTVRSLASIGDGMADILIGYHDVNYLVEVKDGDKPPSKRKLTEDEKKFHKQWCGQVDVALNFEDCLIIMGISTEPSPF